MTIRIIQQWNGYSPDQIVSGLGSTEEARLIGLGFASADLDGPDGGGQVAKLSTDANGNTVLVGEDGETYPLGNSPTQRLSGRVIANYGTLTGYVPTNCTQALVATPVGGSTRHKPNMGNSIRATTSGATASAQVEFPAITVPGNPSGRVDLWVYVEDVSAGPYFTLYLAVEGAYTNHFYKSLPTPTRNGWHCYTVKESEFTVGSGAPTLATVTRGRVRFGCAAATSVIINRVVFGASGTPLVALIWDDGNDSDYDYVLPLLNKYKLIGNFSIIADNIDGPGNLTTDQLKMIADAGHKLIVHGGTNLSTLPTIADAYADMDANRAYLESLGIGADADVYVWPNGAYMYAAGNAGLMDYAESKGYVGAFTVGGTRSTNQLTSYEKFTAARSSNDVSVATATILSGISDHAAVGRSTALMGHEVVASGATGIQTNVADLDTVLAGIAALRDAGTVRVVSARDYLRFNSKA